ncbi:MAG: hypothetical protein QOH25_1102 [Acidobacteriota bacterium]|jgi:hypothetical protein|nr:hypothetical protein [Acidobacteriota bacterium]
MRRTQIFFLLLALLFSLVGYSQQADSHLRKGLTAQDQAREAAAKKAWPAYFAAFRAAVKKRDRATLKEKLMILEFNGSPALRDAAFRKWDNPKVRGWAKFDRVLTLGAVPLDSSGGEQDPATALPSRIAPPAASRGSYKGWFTVFEFREDGRWYCLQFTSPADFR